MKVKEHSSTLKIDRNGVTGSIYALNNHGRPMAGSNTPAFAPGNLANANWGIPQEYSRPMRGGVNQQLRYTFGGDPTENSSFHQTIGILQEMCEKYKDDPEVVRLARRLFNGKVGDYGPIKNYDELGELAAITRYFQGTFTSNTPQQDLGKPLLHGDKGSYRYQYDPYDTEYFQSPAKVIRDIQAGESGADCDDIALAAACVIAASGRPAMLMIVDADEGSPGQFNHVMLASKTMQSNSVYGSNWFPIELIHPLPLGDSVKITKYIPLIVRDYDLRPQVKRMIPAVFR